MFFSKSTGGFFFPEISGASMPDDVVAISDEQYAELREGKSAGKIVESNDEGDLFLIDPPAPTSQQITLGQILELEVMVTERRLREAVLGIDGGWLKDINDQIAGLRATL